MIAFVSVSAASPPTYDEAVKLSETIAHNEGAQKWVEGVFTPFLNQHVASLLHNCIETLNAGETEARFVVDLRAAPKSVAVSDDAPTPFSSCLKGKLQALEWPKVTKEIRYLPISVSARRPKAGPQNADDVIKSVTSTGKSLEPTPPPEGNLDVQAPAEFADFIRAIAVPTAIAHTRPGEFVKFLRIGKNEDGEIVVTFISLLPLNEHATADLGQDAGTLVIAHVHHKLMHQDPVREDALTVRGLGVPNFVISSDGQAIWEVGIVAGQDSYREIGPKNPGEWKLLE